MRSSVKAASGVARVVMGSVVGGIRWGLDRMLSVGYGVIYDYIFERFKAYQNLEHEVLALLEAAVPESANRHHVQVLDSGCGPGNFSFALARSGFSVVGVDRYDVLIDLAREKRRAKHLSNLSFQKADLARGNTFGDRSFDQVVSIHCLYLHPAPHQLLKEAYRVLKPGGYAVFVNFTRRIPPWPSFREVKNREGLRAAIGCLLWLLPNAVFEVVRERIGPHYWQEDEFSARLRDAGFAVLQLRRTFFNEASVLAWVKKDTDGKEVASSVGDNHEETLNQTHHLWRDDLVLAGATRASGEEMTT